MAGAARWAGERGMREPEKAPGTWEAALRAQGGSPPRGQEKWEEMAKAGGSSWGGPEGSLVPVLCFPATVDPRPLGQAVSQLKINDPDLPAGRWQEMENNGKGGTEPTPTWLAQRAWLFSYFGRYRPI